VSSFLLKLVDNAKDYVSIEGENLLNWEHTKIQVLEIIFFRVLAPVLLVNSLMKSKAQSSQ